MIGWVLLVVAAPPASARLEVGPGCFTAEQLADEVSARLGYAPFLAESPLLFQVELVELGEGLEARVTRRQGETAPKRRTVEAARGACAELLASTALTLAVAIDPRSSGAPRASEAPKPVRTSSVAPVRARAALVPKDEAPAPIAPSTLRWALGASGGVAVGSGVAPELSVEVLASWTRLQLVLDVRLGLAQLHARAPAVVAVSTISAGLAPCVELSPFELCGLLRAGVLRGEGPSRERGRVASTPWAAFGVRGGWMLALSRTWQAGVRAELAAPLTSTRFLSGGDEIWRSPSLIGHLGLVARVELP